MQTERPWLAQVNEALLAIVLFGSVLAIGTVHVQVLLTISALAFVGGALSIYSLRRLPKPALFLALLGLFSLVQAIPLPASLALGVSPATARVWLSCLEPLREPALRFFPISLDRGASIAEGLKWFCYAAVYVMALRTRVLRGSAWLATLLFASATLVSVITVVHGIWDYSLVYGLYEPKFAVGRWHMGPLLNSNNFAGYANLGLFAGVGLMLSRSARLPRQVSLVGVAVITTALLLSGSRAAISSAVVGLLLTAIWLKRQPVLGVSRRQLLATGAGLLFAVLVFCALSGPKEWQALGPGDFERKFAVWRWSIPLIRDHALFGVGRGAFETALPPYRQILAANWTAAFSHAENFVIQWIGEWGIPVGAIAVVVIVRHVGMSWYDARSERLRFLVLTGVAVLFLQNLADLGLEVPSLVIAAIVAMAAGRRAPGQEQAPPRAKGLRNAVGALAVLTLVWLAAATWSRAPVEDERREASVRYRALIKPGPPEHALFRSQMRTAMLRHPGEAHFPLLVGVLANRTGAENPLPWLAHALELSPTDGRVHLTLAELLHAHRATTQAFLHLRMAAESDGTLGGVVIQHIAHWAGTLEILKQGIPAGPRSIAMLTGVCETVPRLELKISCFRYGVTQAPRNPMLQQGMAESLLLAIRSGTEPCQAAQVQRCHGEVDRAAKRLGELDPSNWHSGYLVGKNLQAQGDLKGAAEILYNICPAGAEGHECARDSMSVAVASGSDSAISDAADAYMRRACVNGSPCVAELDWVAAALEAAGRETVALKYLNRAAELDDSADRWLRLAQRARQLQANGVATTALDRAEHSPDTTLVSRAI
ncbi:MAG TPA: O-antigen ligase family protein, partial [Polyangiaceae bacterium]